MNSAAERTLGDDLTLMIAAADCIVQLAGIAQTTIMVPLLPLPFILLLIPSLGVSNRAY